MRGRKGEQQNGEEQRVNVELIRAQALAVRTAADALLLALGEDAGDDACEHADAEMVDGGFGPGLKTYQCQDCGAKWKQEGRRGEEE